MTGAKVLVLGSGGREHALAWKIAQSKDVGEVRLAPGNGKTGDGVIVYNLNLTANNFDGVLEYVKEERVDLTVVGPEQPLVDGIVDRFIEKGLIKEGHFIFGPDKQGAQLEGSKEWAKRFLTKHGVPTARYESVTDPDQAKEYLRKNWSEDKQWVVKASGLAAGKGVIVPASLDEAIAAIEKVMVEKKFGAAGDTVVLEERLYGEEASMIALCDGTTYKLLVSTQDHKPVFDNDEGPNTGGMGAYGPAPIITPELEKRIADEIFTPLVGGLQREGIDYKGFIYAGLMITNNGPKVIEINCRCGDPETQPIMMLSDFDMYGAMMACCEGTLENFEVKNKAGSACCVVLASKGYPGKYTKGLKIEGLSEAERVLDSKIFYAGVRGENGETFTSGGRVLGVTGLGLDLTTAQAKAYEVVKIINNNNPGIFHYRTDIGLKGVRHIQGE